MKQRPETEGTSHTVAGKGGGEGDIDMVGRWGGDAGKDLYRQDEKQVQKLEGVSFSSRFHEQEARLREPLGLEQRDGRLLGN